MAAQLSQCSCNPDPPQPLLVTAGFLAFPICCLNPNAHHPAHHTHHAAHHPAHHAAHHAALHAAHHAAHHAAPHAAPHAALDNVDEEKNDAGGEAVRGR